MQKNYYVAIIAGGIGSRFWPKSRTNYPKQFIDILSSGKTLIQDTFERFANFIPIENIYIVTSEKYTQLVQTQLPNLPVENILSEPSRKNTAPCIAYISFKIAQKDSQAKLLIAPSDHIIYNKDEFEKVVLQSFNFVENNDAIITFGIKPTNPNTGYGYIQKNEKIEIEGVFKVKSFTEKPNLELARTFIKTGEFLWNAGIFAWKISTILAGFKKYQPEIYELFDSEKNTFNTDQEVNAIATIFPQCPNISIDIAILEQADNVFVIPASFGWNDLGTWNSIYENIEKDYLDNAVTSKENVIIIDATKCMVSKPKEKLVIIQGIDECIVVDTPDVLLICKKDQEQEIKNYVAEVKRQINKGERFV